MNRSTLLLIAGAAVALLLLNRRAMAADHVSPSNPRQWQPDFRLTGETAEDRAQASVRANGERVWSVPTDIRRWLPDGDLTGLPPSGNLGPAAAARTSPLLQLFSMSEPPERANGAQPPALVAAVEAPAPA
ncbi:MAG: hypothetical protein WCK28_23625, partial [Burkholderiales bacterium]